tara:strand:+ start:1564 stop:1776 length:213 start_codon:yes stop_codon:yes gene_type:complete
MPKIKTIIKLRQDEIDAIVEDIVTFYNRFPKGMNMTEINRYTKSYYDPILELIEELMQSSFEMGRETKDT